jgi:RHS repeat-associated protein
VLWLFVEQSGILAVTGTPPVADAPVAVEPLGGFVSAFGFEPLDLLAALPEGAVPWRFHASEQVWETRLPAPMHTVTNFPSTVPAGGTAFVRTGIPILLAPPDPALRIRYYHQDHLGSTSVITDQNGLLVHETALYPYGLPRHEYSPRGAREPYQFTQKERDAETGLHYFEARFFASIIGRFIRVDPLAASLKPEWLLNPQKLNLYAYCANQPTICFDPSGLDGWTRFWGGVKAVGGAIEIVVGVGAGAATSWTGVGAVAGGAVALHGADTLVAGVRQAVSGEKTQSGTAYVITTATGSETAGDLIDAGIGIVGTAGVGAMAKAPAIAATTAETTSALGGVAKGSGLVHLTTTERAAAITSEQLLKGSSYAGPSANATAEGLAITARTGLLPSQAQAAVQIPNQAAGAFSKVIPVGPFTGWQRFTGAVYTDKGVLNLATGAFTRQGLNGSQMFFYGADAAMCKLPAAVADQAASKSND